MTTSTIIEKLAKDGFVQIETHPTRDDLVVGARVHNSGERYSEARENGTATVVAITRKGTDERPDSWQQSYGRPNIEVVVERDNGERVAWADYGTQVASLFV